MLGAWFDGLDGVRHDGVGVLDVRTTLGDLAEGPVITRPQPALGLPAMSGFESHRGRTELGPGVDPLALLELGTGNGGNPPADGAVVGHVVGTYLHGPVLARNPELADLLLGWAVGGPLPPMDPGFGALVREQRIAEDRADRTGWGGVRH